jgi:putative transposase
VVTQQARQVTWTLSAATAAGSLSHSRPGSQVHGQLDAVFEAQGARIIQTPIQAPEANGLAERFVRTVRPECLDWLLIGGAWHLERALAEFIERYNSRRAHRSLALAPPNGRPAIERCPDARPIPVKRRDRLGGLIHEYQRAA